MQTETIPACRDRLRQLEKQILDAENTLKAIASQTDDLIPSGQLAALDDLRKLEAKESSEVAIAKRKDRAAAIKQSTIALKTEKAKLQAHQKSLEVEALAIQEKIQFAGDVAMRKQSEFWEAIAQLDRLKPDSQRWQRLVGDQTHPLVQLNPHNTLILSRSEKHHDGVPRFKLHQQSAIAMSSIFHQIGIKTHA